SGGLLLRLKLRFTLYLRASLRTSGVLSTQSATFCKGFCICLDIRPNDPTREGVQERWRTDSKRSAVAAAETFSDSTFPRLGRAISPSQLAATRGRNPFPSPPRTITVGPVRSTP